MGSARAELREVVRYAMLAASGHNAQPWAFALTEDTITIDPDWRRRLPAVDPDEREPIEVPALRGELQRAVGLGAARPQLLLRFGHAPSMPRSLRRPVEEVLR